MSLFVKGQACAIYLALLTLPQTALAGTNNPFISDVMTVSGRAELPNASGSSLEGAVEIGAINLDADFLQKVDGDPAPTEGVVREALEKSLSNHGYLHQATDTNKEVGIKPEVFNFDIDLISEEKDNEKIKVKVNLIIDREHGHQNCESIVAVGEYTAYRRNVYKKGGKLISGILGVFVSDAENMFAKKVDSIDDAENETKLAWSGIGQGLSPYDDDRRVGVYAHLKAVQLAITNFLYQIRPGTSCNIVK